MIDGFDDMLSQSDGIQAMARVNNRTLLITLANKIDELERRIDKMEERRMIEDFEQFAKTQSGESNN